MSNQTRIPGRRCDHPLLRLLRLLPVVAITLSVVLMAATPLLARAADGAGPRVDVGKIDGTITPVMERYVNRAIGRAERDRAAAIVFEMDTPGGLSSAMDDIIRDILQSKVPVVVYVGPRGARAASAGVYITYAAHVAAMAPGTNIGSASPIFMGANGGATDGSETLKKKVTNDAVAQITNLANLRQRNAQWAEQAVRDAVNVTADQAVQLKVVDLQAPDLPTLLAQIDGRTVQMASGAMTLATKGATLHGVEMTAMESFLQVLADPTIAYLLLSLGMLGLVLELSHPGVILPGVAGGLCLLLGLFALGTLPVNWAAVLLIAFAFVLFAADLFVTSFGTLTIGGLISFVIGSYLLIGSNAPPGYEVARPVIWTMTVCLVGFFLFIAGAVMKARLRPAATGKQTLIGAVGTARSALRPSGMVYLNGELWGATLERPDPTELAAGQPVTVTKIDGLRLTVRPARATDVAHRRRPAGDPREIVPATSTARAEPTSASS